MSLTHLKDHFTKSAHSDADIKQLLIAPDYDITNKFITQYTSQALHIQPDIALINKDNLIKHNNEEYALIDFGSDKVLVSHGKIIEGEVNQLGEAQVRMYKEGFVLPYVVDQIKKLITETNIKGICVSSHGQIIDSHYIDHIAPEIDKELSSVKFTRNLCGYLEQTIPLEKKPTMFNDAVCGGAFSYATLKKSETQKKHLLYIIIGGGVGGCYINADGEISASEPSHIPWIPYPDDVDPGPCLEAGPHFCAEVYSRGYYLERQLAAKYLGKETDGRTMNELLQKGDKKTEKVYMHGARNISNIIIGLLFGFWLLQEQKLEDTIIITHGGVADNVGLYNKMIQAYLMDYLHTRYPNLSPIPVVPTNELLQGYGDNANALGAAILNLSK